MNYKKIVQEINALEVATNFLEIINIKIANEIEKVSKKERLFRELASIHLNIFNKFQNESFKKQSLDKINTLFILFPSISVDSNEESFFKDEYIKKLNSKLNSDDIIYIVKVSNLNLKSFEKIKDFLTQKNIKVKSMNFKNIFTNEEILNEKILQPIIKEFVEFITNIFIKSGGFHNLNIHLMSSTIAEPNLISEIFSKNQILNVEDEQKIISKICDFEKNIFLFPSYVEQMWNTVNQILISNISSIILKIQKSNLNIKLTKNKNTLDEYNILLRKMKVKKNVIKKEMELDELNVTSY